MKKALTRTIIVCVAVNLMTAGFVLAQNAAEEKKQEVIEKTLLEVIEKEITLAKKEADLDLMRKKMEMEMMAPVRPVVPRVSIPVWQHSGSGAVLVIPAAEMKVEDLAAITEDMAVMSRIFDKKLSQAQSIPVRTLFSQYEPSFFGLGNSAIEAIYLDGYGALFLMKVNALLSPPPEAPEEKETEEEDTDPLWTQMRQEMYAPEEARRRRTDRPEEKYDAEKVKELKETLIKTLKHAANIRTLKPDESVILSVTGKAGQSATRTTTRSYGPEGVLSGRRRSSRSYNMPIRPVGAETGFSSPTVLTIRAKKSDIDAFAKGQLTFDQFKQKTQLLSYSYLGGNIGGGPSRSSPTDMLLRSLTDGR